MISKTDKFNRLTVSVIAIAATTAPLFATSAKAAGLQLMPGSSNFGTAGAGHAAIGLGAGSAWANPATMTLIEGQQIALGVIAAKTDIQFKADDPDVESGGDSGGEIYIPSFAYLASINDKMRFGFSVVVPYGNSLDYDNDWEGNNVAIEVSLETIQAMPSFAYRINNQFSLGFGITANHTSVEQELQMTILRNTMDVALEADSIDYGWTLGGLYELNASHRIGFVYRSQVDSDLTGTGSVGSSDYDANLNWENPASIVISGYHQVSDDITLLWDLGRTFYSAFEETHVELEGFPTELALERNWKDANRYAIGTHYQLNENVILQAGYSYEESTVETVDRSVDLPLDSIQRFTVGAIYKVSQNTDISLGLEYADLGSPEIEDNGDPLFASPEGEYDNSAMAGSLSINYKL